MTKFEIRTDHFEFRGGNRPFPPMSADEIFDTYMSCDTRITSNCLDPKIEASFDTIDDARAAFAAYADYGRTRQWNQDRLYYLSGEMAWIEVNTYDEDGDFDQGGEVLDMAVEAYNSEASSDAK